MLILAPVMTWAATAMASHSRPVPQKIIIDTDIGDAFDDALVLGLALSNRELRILGVTTAFGDTALRARLVDRLLRDTARTDIPVAAGRAKHHRGEAAFTQRDFAAAQPARTWPDAADFLLDRIRHQPGEITLIAIAPLTNLGDAVDRDPAAFSKLKRIVMMGGSIHRGYGASGRGPDAEYNIAMDIAAARKVLNSGVPLTVMPLDATQYGMDDARRQHLLTPGPDATGRTRRLLADLALLYRQWAAGTHERTLVLYDVAALAYALKPALCPVTPMRIEIDGDGATRSVAGQPNSVVCLHTAGRFFERFMPRPGRE